MIIDDIQEIMLDIKETMRDIDNIIKDDDIKNSLNDINIDDLTVIRGKLASTLMWFRNISGIVG